MSLPNPYPVHLPVKTQKWELEKWLDKKGIIEVEDERRSVLEIWEELIIQIPIKEFPLPIWLNIIFPIEDTENTPLITFLQITFQSLNNSKVKQRNDSFIAILCDSTNDKNYTEIYQWKKDFIRKNWLFYLKYQSIFDNWWKKHNGLLNKNRTYRKLELSIRGKYQEGEIFSFKNYITQFRHSGVRVKYFNFFPTVTRSYSPIIIYEKRINNYRYLTIHEVFQLFGFNGKKLSLLNKISSKKLFTYLGDSINVKVLEYLFGKVFFSVIKQSLEADPILGVGEKVSSKHLTLDSK